MKQISTALNGAVLLLDAIGCSTGKVRAATSFPPPLVEATPVIQKDVPIQAEWVETLERYVNTQISSQVSGYPMTNKVVPGSNLCCSGIWNGSSTLRRLHG